MPITTVILNSTVLSDQDLATEAAAAIERNEMAPGLWGIKVHSSGAFDCSFMFRDSTGCNAIINHSVKD